MRCVVVAVALAAGAVPGLAQEREYHVTGTVVDAAKQALEGVTLEIRERQSRRAYKITTDKRGVYKLVGLSHGAYDVTASKPGYQTRTIEWSLREPQDPMRKVQYDPLVLLSETQVSEIKRDTELKEELGAATALIHKEDFEGALVELAKMLARSPDDANALYLAAICHVRKGRAEAATPLLERVVQLSPDFVAARVQLGACYELRGQAERALAAYDAALKIDPQNLVALYNAGVLHYNAGHAGVALPYFETAARVKPDDDRALEMAGYCHLQALHYPEALRYFERARALVTDEERAGTLDEILQELRPRVQGTPAPGAGS
jgi:tetratricopeptide (TPR) repeat protein